MTHCQVVCADLVTGGDGLCVVKERGKGLESRSWGLEGSESAQWGPSIGPVAGERQLGCRR